MKSTKSLAAWIMICAAILAAPGCFIECSDEIVAQAVSADGRRKAILRVRDCGATTRFYNRLIVTVPEEWWPVDALRGPLCLWKPEQVDLRWEGNDLVMACTSCCERVREKVEMVGKSRIRYKGI